MFKKALLAGVALLAAAPPLASAGTVSAAADGALTYTPRAGDTNTVSLKADGSSVRIVDRVVVGLAASTTSQCKRITPVEVSCVRKNFASPITVKLGDGDDSFQHSFNMQAVEIGKAARRE